MPQRYGIIVEGVAIAVVCEGLLEAIIVMVLEFYVFNISYLLTSSDKTQYLFSENLDIGAKKLKICYSNSVFGPKIDVSAF